jgi:hypothetical protein
MPDFRRRKENVLPQSYFYALRLLVSFCGFICGDRWRWGRLSAHRISRHHDAAVIRSDNGGASRHRPMLFPGESRRVVLGEGGGAIVDEVAPERRGSIPMSRRKRPTRRFLDPLPLAIPSDCSAGDDRWRMSFPRRARPQPCPSLLAKRGGRGAEPCSATPAAVLTRRGPAPADRGGDTSAR